MTKKRFKFRHVNEITGTFVILVVVALIAAIVWTAYSRRWFRGTVTLWVVMPEGGAAGIREGSQVYFLGTLVGSVSDVIVDETGRMEAETSIRSDFFRFVRKDSFAIVKKKFGVAGDSYFDITRGEGQPLPEKDATIICKELPSTIGSAIEEARSTLLPVLDKVNAGLDAWTKLGTNLEESRQRVDPIIGRLDGLVSDLEQGKGTAGKLLTDPAIANELKTVIGRLDGLVSDLEQGKGTAGKLLTDPAIAEELKTLTEKGNASMDQLHAILKNVELAGTDLAGVSETLATEAEDLTGLVLQTQQTLHEMEKLIEGVQKHWLIRKYIEEPPPDTRLPPGEVAP